MGVARPAEGGISVERLTKEGKFCDVIECELTPGGSFCERGTCTERRLWERLSSIEDILGNDYDLDRLRVIINQRMSMRDEVAKRFEITKDIPLDRLRELVEAGRGGRCVVLPCKIGDTIYDISCAGIKESKVVSISFSASELPYHVSICAENYNYAVTIDIEMNDFIEIDDFGKIVFFTREEAEAALEEMKNG